MQRSLCYVVTSDNSDSSAMLIEAMMLPAFKKSGGSLFDFILTWCHHYKIPVSSGVASEHVVAANTFEFIWTLRGVCVLSGVFFDIGCLGWLVWFIFLKST